MQTYKIINDVAVTQPIEVREEECTWEIQRAARFRLHRLHSQLGWEVSGVHRRLPLLLASRTPNPLEADLRWAAEHMMKSRLEDNSQELKTSAFLLLGLGKVSLAEQASALPWVKRLQSSPALADAWIHAAALSVNLSFRLDSHPNIYRVVPDAQSIFVAALPNSRGLLVQALVFTDLWNPNPPVPEERPRRLVKLFLEPQSLQPDATLADEAVMLANLAEGLHELLLTELGGPDESAPSLPPAESHS